MQAKKSDAEASPEGPTAFVFAGGGSLGAVEVGMLRALVEAEVRPELVVGSSVGALNGAFFAGAPDAEGVAALEEIWCGIRRRDVFPMGAVRGLLGFLGHGRSLLSAGPLRELLERALRYQKLEEALLPCHVVATDLMRGEEVVISEGPAVPALMASSAIPAVFPPVEHNGRHLVDGGIASNTPIGAALALGAKRVVVLPTGFSCRAERPARAALGVALQALNLMIARQLSVDVEQLRRQVVLRVVPPLCPLDRHAYDFSGTRELIDRATRSTRAWLSEGGLERDEIPGSLPPHAH